MVVKDISKRLGSEKNPFSINSEYSFGEVREENFVEINGSVEFYFGSDEENKEFYTLKERGDNLFRKVYSSEGTPVLDKLKTFRRGSIEYFAQKSRMEQVRRNDGN
ncbi:MAG: hypothetical protein KC516_00445 [Nanoarchaeota archaeon]|nr:hypothetical protein [Nanoarchaeota archaeon]